MLGGEPITLPQSLKMIGISLAKTKELPAKKKAPPPSSVIGLLMMDSSLNVMWFNPEAMQILGYPDNISNAANSEILLGEKVRSVLIARTSADEATLVSQFRSGKRLYFCRSFAIDSLMKADPQAKGVSHHRMVVLLERGPSGLVLLSEICQQFNLTRRENEVLEYLLQGMSSKAIAKRMNVSPNTVKTFLRLIMIKTGTLSRSALITKIFMAQPRWAAISDRVPGRFSGDPVD